MPATDGSTAPTTGTVEWFDAERGVGLISSDDGTPPCAVYAATLRAWGVASLAAGDRVLFQVRDGAGERTRHRPNPAPPCTTFPTASTSGLVVSSY